MKYFLLLFFVSSLNLYSQADSLSLDDKYREDQFYAALTYNLLLDKPSGVGQHNLSRTLHLGFVRDFPINEARNKGLGVGVGYSHNLLYMNLEYTDNQYRIFQMGAEKTEKSYFQFHSLDIIPLEFRWRTSTAETFSFWRIYAGAKVSYLFAANYRKVSEQQKIYEKVPDIQNKFLWKSYASFGYGTWNIFFEYTFTPIFQNKKTITNTPIPTNMFNVGLIFYIL